MTSLTHLNRRIDELSERSDGRWRSLKKIVRCRYRDMEGPSTWKAMCVVFIGGVLCERLHKSRHASGNAARYTANFFLRQITQGAAAVSGGLALGLHPVLRTMFISKSPKQS